MSEPGTGVGEGTSALRPDAGAGEQNSALVSVGPGTGEAPVVSGVPSSMSAAAAGAGAGVPSSASAGAPSDGRTAGREPGEPLAGVGTGEPDGVPAPEGQGAVESPVVTGAAAGTGMPSAVSGTAAGEGRAQPRETGDTRPVVSSEAADAAETGAVAASETQAPEASPGTASPTPAAQAPATPAAARTADWVRQVLGADRATETGADATAQDPSQTSTVTADGVGAASEEAPARVVSDPGLAPVPTALGLQPDGTASAGDGLLGALVGAGQDGHLAGGEAMPAPTQVPGQAGERLAHALTAELDRPAGEGRPLWDALDGRAQAAWAQGLVGGGPAQAPTVWGDDQRRAVVGALQASQSAPQVAGTGPQAAGTGTAAGEGNARQPAQNVPTEAQRMATVSDASWQEDLGSPSEDAADSESGTTGFDDDASSVSSYVSDDLWDTGSIATETDATTDAGGLGMPGAGGFQNQAAEGTPTFWNDLKAETDSTLRDLGIDHTVDVKEVREQYAALSSEDRALARNMSDLAFRIAARIAVPGRKLGLPGGATLAADDFTRGSDSVLVAAASEFLNRDTPGKGKKRDRTREELEVAFDRHIQTESDLVDAVTGFARWIDYVPDSGAPEAPASREQYEAARDAFDRAQLRHELADARLQSALESAEREQGSREQQAAPAPAGGSGEAFSRGTDARGAEPEAAEDESAAVAATTGALESSDADQAPTAVPELESEAGPKEPESQTPETLATPQPPVTPETPQPPATPETAEDVANPLPEWREVASEGPGNRPYRVQVPGGLIEATSDGTRLAPDGWVAYGSDLLHLASGTVMDGSDGRLVPVPSEFLEYLAEFTAAPGLTLSVDDQGLLFTGDEKGPSPVRVAVAPRQPDGPGARTAETADGDQDATAADVRARRPDVTEDQVRDWARSWGVSERRVDLALRHPWFQPGDLDALANTLALPTEDRARLLDLSEEIGRVPTDMAALAAQLDMHTPADFHRVALDLRIDPRHLANLFGDRLRQLGRGMAEDAGILVTSVRHDLRNTYPEATHPREQAWLLHVAAHHDIPWRAFTAGGVLGYLHDHGQEVGPGSLPHDATQVAELLERARWELPPVSAESLGHTPRQLAELAPRIGTSKHKLTEAAGYWWFRPEEALGLRRSLGVSSGDRLLELVKATHRVPTDIEELARQLRMPNPKDLYQVARDLRADPRDLMTLFGDRLSGLGRPSESGRVETPAPFAAEIRGTLRSKYPTSAEDIKATAWLLRVATHHEVPWADFARGGVLAHLNEHREIAVPGTTPYDSELVGELVRNAPRQLRPGRVHTAQELSGWGALLGSPEVWVRHMIRQPWFGLGAAARLRGLLGVRDGSRLLRLADSIGRVPMDIPRLARQLGMRDAKDLYRVAHLLGADPRDIAKLFPDRLTELGRGGAQDRADALAAEIGRALTGGYPEAVQAQGGSAWLLRVAAHHDIPWNVFTTGVLPSLRESRGAIGPGLTQPDSAQVALLVQPPAYRRPPAYSDGADLPAASAPAGVPVESDRAALPAEAVAPRAEELPAYAEPVRLTDLEASAWAGRWQVPLDRLTPLRRYSWFRPEAVEELRTSLGITNVRPLLNLSNVIGRIPTDVPALAVEAGMRDPKELVEVAADLWADPRDLMTLFRGRLTSFGRVGPDGRTGRPAELVAELKSALGERVTHDREPTWLYAVAAAHGVSGADILNSRFVTFLRSRRNPPVMTPVDDESVANAVDDWWQSGERSGRTRDVPAAAWEIKQQLASGPPPRSDGAASGPAPRSDGAAEPTGMPVPAPVLSVDAPAGTDTPRRPAPQPTPGPDRPVQQPEELVGWLKERFGDGRQEDVSLPAARTGSDDGSHTGSADTGLPTEVTRMLRVLQRELPVGWAGLVQGAGGLLRPFLGRRTMTAGEDEGSRRAGALRREALVRIASALHASPERTTELLTEAGSRRDTAVALPGGAPPQNRANTRRFGRAQAVELARAAVRVDAAAAVAEAHFVRSPTAESVAANDLAGWFMELVSQAQLPSPFEPSAGLVRMFSAIRADRRGTVTPDVVTYLHEQPDLVATVVDNPRLRAGVVTRPGLARVLGPHPKLTRELAADLDNASIVDDAMSLVKYPEFAAALENDAVLLRQAVGCLGLVDVLGGDLLLVRATADAPWLVRALRELPQLSEVVRTADAPLPLVRALKDNVNLLLAIRASRTYPDAAPDAAQLGEVLRDTGLIRAMNRYPQQLWTLFRVPGLLAAAQEDPGVLAVLDSDPELSDVLTDNPALATRLARSPELLRVAFGNGDLAEALSYDPRRFDATLSETELRLLLGTAAPLRQSARREPGAQARPLQRLLADPRVQAALQGHNELATELMKAPVVVDALLARPELLRTPHEYRRLLAPGNAALRSQLKPGSPLLDQGVLRALLRTPPLTNTVAHAFSVANTAAAGPEDPRRRYGTTLAAHPGIRDLVYADTGFREFLVAFNAMIDQINGTAGFGEALRTEGRFSGLINRDPFVLQLIGENPRALPALLANGSALLELALAARHLIVALGERRGRLEDAAAHPRLLRALASHPNDTTISPHWARLFGDRALMEALDSEAGLTLAGALAAEPDLLTDALGRDTFVEELKRPGGLDRYVTLSRTPGALAEAVRGEEPSITRSGVAVPAGLAGLAMAITAQPESEARRRVEEAVARGDLAAHRRAAKDALRALKERPELRAAIEREFGIILAMLSNPEMTPTLLKRPELVAYLADPTTGALKAVHNRPELTRGLRENGRLYVRFISEPYFVQTLGSDSSSPFAEALGRNREFIRVHELGANLPVKLTGDNMFIVAASEAIAAAVVDDKTMGAGLAGSPGLVEKLSDLFTDENGGVVTGVPWDKAETVARLVVSSPVLMQALAENPDRLDGLVEWPDVTRVLAENAHVLKTKQAAGMLLDNERLVARFHLHPGQAATVLRTPGLLLVASRSPRLLSAMAASEHVAALLKREQSVRTLLWNQPEVVDDLLRMPGLGQALSGLPGLVEAMNSRPAVAERLRADPGLLAVLRARRTLVDELARDTALWRAVTVSPALVEALSQSARALRYLRRRPVLAGVLASAPDATAVSAAQLRAVLSDDELTALLDAQPRLAELVLGSPELADRAVEDAGFVERVRGLARERGRLEGLLQAPDRLLQELDRLRTASRSAGSATRQVTGSGARGERAVPSAGPGTQGAATTVRPERATVPRALRPLERGHREVLAALTRDREVVGLLEETGLLGRVVEYPELAALVAAFPELAEEWQPASGRVDEFRFDRFAGRDGLSWDLERDFAAYADHLGTLDVVLHGESRGWVRSAVEPAWRAAESAHREAVAAEQREREERLSAFRVHLPETWEYSGDVHYGNRLAEGSFSAAQRRTLTALAQGASRPREPAVRVNQALHAHLDGGSGGVSFAYVLGGDGRVGLLAYGVSSSRQGNDYRWDGNGSTHVSGPLRLEAVEDAPLLLASQQTVQRIESGRAESSAAGPGKRAKKGKGKAKTADKAGDSGQQGASGRQADTAPVQQPEELVRWLGARFRTGAEPGPADAELDGDGLTPEAAQLLAALKRELPAGWGDLVTEASGLLWPFVSGRAVALGQDGGSRRTRAAQYEAQVRIASALHADPQRTRDLLVEAGRGLGGTAARPGAARNQAGAPPVSFGATEARRLARSAVEMESVTLVASGLYTRNAGVEAQTVGQVTSWLTETVRQARATRAFEPTVEMARLFIGVDASLRDAFQPEVLAYLSEQPDLLALVSESGRLRPAVLTQPGFAQFLSAYPNLMGELASNDTDVPLHEHAAFLMRHRDVAAALESDSGLRQRAVKRMSMISLLGGKLPLIRGVGRVWLVTAAVTEVPQLAEALRTSSSPMAAVRVLTDNPNLTLAIRRNPDAVPDAKRFRELLGSAGLVRAMYRYPQQLATVFRVPELLAAVQ
ncbi:hypothetical protein, partial [Streptomyces sp. NPDC001770]